VRVLLSSEDLTAHEYLQYTGSQPAWRAALGRGTTVTTTIEGADHTFSDPGAADRAAAETLAWLGELAQRA
jgi:hypothetical protein